MIADLSQKAALYLQKLCLGLPDRRVGSAGNRAATRFFAKTIDSFGFQAEGQLFSCLHWIRGHSQLSAAGQPFEAFISPYSLGCRVTAPLVLASTVEDLAAIEATGQILLLQGDLAREQLMPKNFTFYNPEHHQRIVSLLEAKAPAAIVAATTRNPELAGGMYPFPLIEDGDFDIPSVYMTAEEGQRLAQQAGQRVFLAIDAIRVPSWGENIIGRQAVSSVGGQRLVVCAHIDAKEGTPGALDNAAGVIVLLLLAELARDYDGRLGLELVALNGEDHYSAQGQKEYLRRYRKTFSAIRLAANIDGAGYIEGKTDFSLYNPPDEVAAQVRRAFPAEEGFLEGQPWYQSDHSIFIQNGVPAMAITSAQFMELSTHITHTPQDRPELVDPDRLAHIALALHRLLLGLEELPA